LKKDNNSDQIVGSVLIIGAGISGMQSALDLAESGYKVYIVEKSPAIGGHMPMLDKTFPTNDCAMCILSPKLVECGRHRNIEIFTSSDVIGLTGEAGNFSVKINKRPRYVDPDKCLGCGACAEECPIGVANEFNQYLSERKAIYKLYPQAYPNSFAIDATRCLRIKKPRACGKCLEVCPVDAINHEMQAEEVQVQVGSIILGTGYELFDSELRGEFGFGVYDNVLTSLQFERMLSASGPYEGHLQKADGAEPKKIAFIQCVGSRDVSLNRGYCSSVCCMYATKEAVIAKEHQPDLDVTIFCIDVRAYGKDYEKYYNRARYDYGVKYVKCMVSSVKEQQQSKELRIRYRTADAMVEEDFDLVVLSVGLKPSKESTELAGILGIDLNQYDYCRTSALTGVSSSRKGIYVAGVFSGPKDIPETVMQASAAAGDCAAFLSPARNSLVTEREFPQEIDVSGQEPRIGVFICHCGKNIAGVVDVPAVVEHVKKLPHVVYATNNIYACSQDSQAAMRELIEEYKLNRIVVSSCSPRTHKPLFQETLREAGLNPYLFEMANIRDQCSWVHMHEPAKATEKAKDLSSAAISKAALLAPIKNIKVNVTQAALIIGGGVAGMTSALNLAEQGYRVHLLEQNENLGGNARLINRGFNNEDISALVADLSARVINSPCIDIYNDCSIREVSGYKGNFTTLLSDGRQVKHGVTIVATGAKESKPVEYLYGQDPRVMTQLELDQAIAAGEPRAKNARSIVMIQCVGSREEQRPYCSRICCSKTMQLALQLKEINPDCAIIVLYRDIRTYGFLEDHYRAAREKGVLFFRYEQDNKPVVEAVSRPGEEDVLQVTATDHVFDTPFQVNPDLVILAAPVTPPESNRQLSQLLKVPLNQDGFFQEAHMKLRPVDFASEGVFMCGLAHGPKNIEETITQAKAAAGRASVILSRDTLESGGVVAVVQTDKCAACLTCVRLCPFKAPTIKNHKAEIESVICQGCGTCAAECPNKAITLQYYSDNQINRYVDGFFR